MTPYWPADGVHPTCASCSWAVSPANLVEHSNLIPVWVVDGTVPASNVLLAADGSQATLRALDHMAFMLSGQPTQPIQMLHVRPRIQDYCEITMEKETIQDAESVLLDEDRHCMDDFYSQALAVLQKNGVDNSRLKMQYTLKAKMSVPRSIVGYARDKGFRHHRPGPARAEQQSLFRQCIPWLAPKSRGHEPLDSALTLTAHCGRTGTRGLTALTQISMIAF